MRKESKRGSGVLMPISALPARYGIGTFGEEAYKFADMLEIGGFRYWQVLPLGPTSFGDSPYQSPSAFAGNPYFIDLDILCEKGYLKKDDLTSVSRTKDCENIDYAWLYNTRYKVLYKAYEGFKKSTEYNKLGDFPECEPWVRDYAIFMTLKNIYKGKVWCEWDDEYKFRDTDALDKFEKKHKDDIEFYIFIQYEFYLQWNKLKAYINQKGISVIGDMPIYVSYDSADVWVNPELFRLDEKLNQTEVAGCPPDAFAKEGQKWGNPLYNWANHEVDNFSWFKERMKALHKLYDKIRIDHFIGIVRYYCIPYDKSAVYGWYEKGPARKLTDAIIDAVGANAIIAEDLGVLTKSVVNLLKKTGFPGMKVLEFAFDGNPSNDHLPHNLKNNCVAYIGTHDNEPLRGYLDTRNKKELAYIMEYLDVTHEDEIMDRMINMLFSSVADTVILQMQDILKLPMYARTNLPSTLGINWKWRMKKGAFKISQAKKLNRLNKIYGR